MVDQKQILSKLREGIVAETHNVSGKLCIVTPMYYPNGDAICVYFDNGKNGLFMTDEGATRDNLHHRGIDLTSDRRAFVRSVCNSRGAFFKPPRITMDVKPRTLHDDVFTFCQTITDVSSLHYHCTQYTRSAFNETVFEVIRRKIEVATTVERNWTDSTIDPKGSFPVDYHIVQKENQYKHVFAVASGGKANVVAMVSHFLRSHGLDIPTLSIVDPKADLTTTQLDRIQYASSTIVHGISGNQRKIVRFALGSAA